MKLRRTALEFSVAVFVVVVVVVVGLLAMFGLMSPNGVVSEHLDGAPTSSSTAELETPSFVESGNEVDTAGAVPKIAESGFVQRASKCGIGSNLVCEGGVCSFLSESPEGPMTGISWMLQHRRYVFRVTVDSALDVPVSYCEDFMAELNGVIQEGLFFEQVRARPGWMSYCFSESMRSFGPGLERSDAARVGLRLCDDLLEGVGGSRAFTTIHGGTVPVVVAVDDIPPGTTLELEHLTVLSALPSALPEGVYLATKHVVGSVAVSSFTQGEMLRSSGLQPSAE